MSNAATAPEAYSADVRGQYEDLPYPYRDIEQEGNFFSSCDPYSLTALSHAGWGGKRHMRKGLRILIAGCGTGDTTIQYAEELLGAEADIVAIDLSSKSIEIAKARMAKRGLSNATFHHMSILDLPNAGLGQFDVIESSGVLHHLPDPNAGLAALVPLLKDDGLMAIMVYAQYGRYSVYLVQELMKKLMTENTPRAQKIAIAREFLNAIPQGHWLTVNNAAFLPDIQFPDGSGIYDLFLHSTDRAYTVPQIYDWVEGRGLQLVDFFSDMTDDSLYTPDSYNGSPMLREIFAQKTKRERHEIAELMSGNISKHFFYAAKQPKQAAEFADDMVITYGPMQGLFAHFADGFYEALDAAAVGQRLEGKARPFSNAPHLFITKTPYTVALMKLVDGKRSIGAMVRDVAKQTGGAASEIRHALEMLYREYRSRQLVFLRHESIAPYPTGPEIAARVKKHLARS